MNAIVYVNTPLEKSEHDQLARLAKQNGRSKGQQLRMMLQTFLASTPTRKPRRTAK